MIRPFVNAILASAVIAYVFYPVYRFLNKKIKRKNLSALLVSIIIILVLSVPFFFVLNTVANESRVFYLTIKQRIAAEGPAECAPAGSVLCGASAWLSDFLANPSVKFYIENLLSRFTTFFINEASGFLLSIPVVILNIFIAVFITFYLLRDGPQLVRKLGALLPIKKDHQLRILNSFTELTSAMMYGQIILALVQGALGALGFVIFGISSPILWGLVMAILSFLPFFGTAVIWIPAGVVLIINGALSQNMLLVWKGIGLLVYGALIISSVDNVLRPKIVGDKARLHPILVLLGVLGGLRVFGFIGFIIGPLILVLFITFVRIYEGEKHEITS